MRVIVTGSRDLADRAVVRRALYDLLNEVGREPLVVVHGACPTGADRWADEWARNQATIKVQAERHPAEWDVHGKAAGMIRNGRMVQQGADLVLAFFQPGAQNRGTADCVRRAEAAGIPVRRYPQEPTPQEWAALAQEPDDTPALRARLDELKPGRP